MSASGAVRARGCRKTGCNVATDHVCLDDFAVGDCPNAILADEGEPLESMPGPSVDKSTDGEEVGAVALVTVPNSDQLSPSEVDALLRERTMQIVSLMGATASGKTTLIAAIYEAARKRNVAGYELAGSSTLAGLEYRCYLARDKSGLSVSDQEHTSKSLGLHFLHLCLARECTEEKIDRIEFLFADRPGEDFDTAVEDPASCSQLAEVRLCQPLLVLVDGEKLVDANARTGHIDHCRTLIRNIRDYAGLWSGLHIQLVLTKLDSVRAKEQDTVAEQVFDSFCESVSRMLRNNDVRITFHKIAARPKFGELPEGFGLDGLVAEWLVKPQHKPLSLTNVPRLSESEFDRLLFRQFTASP